DLNLASPKQLEQVLFDELGLKSARRTKTGRSTDAEALEASVMAESPTMSREFATQVTRLLDALKLEHIIVPVSAMEGTGLDELYTLAQGAVGQSEDVTPEYDTFLPADAEEPTDLAGDGELN
ncbi:MAG: DNA polymerase, partial [Thermoplasmatota archaeon]